MITFMNDSPIDYQKLCIVCVNHIPNQKYLNAKRWSFVSTFVIRYISFGASVHIFWGCTPQIHREQDEFTAEPRMRRAFATRYNDVTIWNMRRSALEQRTTRIIARQ